MCGHPLKAVTVFQAIPAGFFQKLKVAEIKLETGDLNVGDTIMVIGPTTGIVEYRVGEIRVELKSAPKASKGEYCSIPAPDFFQDCL